MINISLKKNNELQKKIILFLFFGSLLIIGSSIFDFYGVSIDEAETRSHGFITLHYIYEIFSPSRLSTLDGVVLVGKEFLGNVPKLHDFSSKDHGAIIDTFFAFIEVTFNVETTKNQYLFRHYLCFIIFCVGIYFFYLLVNFRHNDWRIGILASAFLVLSPRMFAESFYNNKDIVFMSLYTISLYCCFKFIYKPNVKHAVFFSLTSAIATDVRLMGIMLPFLTIGFLLYLSLGNKNFLKKNLLFIIIFLFLLPTFIYIFWPYLWPDPIANFAFAFKKFASYPWGMKSLYLGNYEFDNNLPWHYLITWIGVTTPIFYTFLFIIGFYIILARFVKRLININEQKEYSDLWRGKKEMLDLLLFFNFFIPVFLIIILGSTLLDGWRHLYFIYPSFLLLSIYGFQKIKNRIKKTNLKNYFVILTILVLLTNLINMVRMHPHQNVYFNLLAGKNPEKNF